MAKEATSTLLQLTYKHPYCIQNGQGLPPHPYHCLYQQATYQGKRPEIGEEKATIGDQQVIEVKERGRKKRATRNSTAANGKEIWAIMLNIVHTQG